MYFYRKNAALKDHSIKNSPKKKLF